MSGVRVPGWRLAAVALLPLLGGCIAAAALPVLTSGALIARKATGTDQREERGPASRGTAEAASANAGVRLTTMTKLPPPTAADVAGAPAGSGGARMTGLSALPPPSGAEADRRFAPRAPSQAGASPWAAFASYAVQQATAGATRSALLESPVSLTRPKFVACGEKQPAVIIDLDRDKEPFAPAGSPGPASDDLRRQLPRVRDAGIAVIWVSQQSASAGSAVESALQASGLDPAGRDRLLLVRSPDERKQTLREAAGKDLCVVAMAGDRLGDFDEFFDYLRDPASAEAFDAQLGSGWFLVPPPLG